MATGTLPLAPDLLDSWLFRQLRPAIAPLARVEPKVVVQDVASEQAAVAVELTVEQEAQILAQAAREFQGECDAIVDGLNNIHGRSFDDVSEAFAQRLDALAVALESNDFETARHCANRFALVVNDLQANVPAWTYVRGLQLLVRRCSKIDLDR